MMSSSVSKRKTLLSVMLFFAATVGLALLLPVPKVSGQATQSGQGNQAFGFNASHISGFPGGRAAELTGGGAFNLAENFANSGGSFSCLSDITAGPFTGCKTGQGVRWDTASLLASSNFQCTGADAVKTATTGNTSVALVADFYRQGDGDVESFTAKMIVSETDLAPEIAGVQNVWIQGVGCGSGVVSFR
jgi:hypothetical protein